MNKPFAVTCLAAAIIALSGCTSVEQGHVGVRVWPNGNIDEREIQSGFAQVAFGSVRHYVANDITWSIRDLHPFTKDKSKLHDLDLTYTYSIEPSQIVDSVIKYKGRDAVDEDGTYYPLARYIENVVSDVASDVIKDFDALEVNQNREGVRNEMLVGIKAKLKADGFDGVIIVNQIFIKNLEIDPNIVRSATEVITAQNTLKAKEYEVQTAKKEADRLGLLAENSKNIDYMNANSLADIAAAVREGKVQTIVVPYDFKGIVNIK